MVNQAEGESATDSCGRWEQVIPSCQAGREIRYSFLASWKTAERVYRCKRERKDLSLNY